MPVPQPSPHSSTRDSVPGKQVQKLHSCVLCAQRKVRCDKMPGGCSNCAKARLGCVYKAPAPPRRRKKGVREIDVGVRLRVYEEALRERGVDPEELVRKKVGGVAIDRGRVGVGRHVDEDEGKGEGNAGVLVSDGGRARYLENTLWTRLQSEFGDTKRILEESSDEDGIEDGFEDPGRTPRISVCASDILLAYGRVPSSLRAFHPTPQRILKLWQVYLDNINPLIKVFHAPSVQQMILDASQNLDEVPKNVEALMFGVYCAAVESLGERDCVDLMGDSKILVSQRFKAAAQMALVRAGFLKTSDLVVLQAFVLFTSSLIGFDARVIWILTGVASRIGKRIGLHRDPETLGLPPFECEIRRRLWYQIKMSDGFAKKLCGTGGTMFFGDVKRPSNLNDSDLFPGMKELPPEHEGATEMMFFLIRCHLGEFLRHPANPKSTYDGVWNKMSGSATSLAIKDKMIDELEALYQRKFLDYCDESIPWHFMCTSFAKGIIDVFRFIAHCPEGTDAKLPQSEKNLLFTWAVSVIRRQNKAYTKPGVQGFLWNIHANFGWKPLLYFISALKYRTHGPEVDAAWKEVQTVFEFHPQLRGEVARQALPIAVSTLTLVAWDKYVAARGVPESGEPYFIQALRARKEMEASRGKHGPNERASNLRQCPAISAQNNCTLDPLSQQGTPQPGRNLEDSIDVFQWDGGIMSQGYDPQLGDISMDDDQLQWSNWDDVLLNFEVQNANNFAMDGAWLSMPHLNGHNGTTHGY